ncbi:TetR family transcriptional regulator C-terminal domain-containing protein [Rouxiella badensis]|jgi:TetR/AcrR family transcriptional regulator|uniref:TetR family transcriptional regulator n=1 Tax=Rouxiella badensis TaxID=1646377 RepID=A0A1X0WGW3_9GAMM|nr:TetR family transcriptional regulator C-terminal domain-containing protein [Rouxiella badensis]MCC3701889.1 TetR family transcriptional regulator C-terminal domain-containing protein [Rouxiella badensis]MCC3718046.1 TetR family transcriptional regulator C-terminal domain-containing protein [Rouxiella badensis]MCC3727186.1 TetR family transcriptional regulator C-terminal domain-containing protein [Rouxiella badensis]MCC3731530.1 TetR family transcriptional regulator C-terminal domain-containi
MNSETSSSRVRMARERMIESIHAAAIAEFSEKGFQGATTQAIAQRAGMKKTQLHYYIAGKEELYEELLQKVLSVWGEIIKFDHSLVEPEAVLSRYIRNKLNFSFNQPELSRIFTSEVLSGAHYLEKYWPEAIAKIVNKENLINQWIEQGKLRPLDARLFIMNIWAVTQYYADFAVQVNRMYRDITDSHQNREHIINEVTTLILRGSVL